jgi:hypothetical protein
MIKAESGKKAKSRARVSCSGNHCDDKGILKGKDES